MRIIISGKIIFIARSTISLLLPRLGTHHPEHVDIVIKTIICLLHNIIIDKEGKDETLFEQVHRDPTINSETHSVSRRNNRSRTEVYIIRDTFKDYFTTVGAIK